MAYQLGVDLGTTWIAAATLRDTRVDTLALGNRSATLPAVVYLGPGGVPLVGAAAERRAVLEPHTVAREFKRLVGRTAAVRVGTSEVQPEALMALAFSAVLDIATEREGGLPDTIAVTHPANWSADRVDLLRGALDPRGATLVTVSEPEAAAVAYDSAARVPVGTTVAVYDLGGGTFDAVVLRREADGMRIVGRPAGVERLGGIDFDAAVFTHVKRLLGLELDRLDPTQSAVATAVARLRADCVDAKEALSADTQVQIPVLLPEVQTELRLTRAELETMIRPALRESVASMQRTIADAGLAVADVDVVLAVGGSSRIPLVSEMLSHELGRPVAVDADPKHVVARGAALVAGGAAEPAATPPTSVRDGGNGAPAMAPPPLADAPRHSRGPVVAAAVIVVAVIGAVAAIGAILGGGGDGGGIAAASTTTAVPAGPAEGSTTTEEGSTATTAAVVSATATATATAATTALPRACAALGTPSVCLTRVDFSRTDDNNAAADDYLIAEFVTAGFEPSAAQPVHIFFDESVPTSNQRWTRGSPYENGAGLTTFTVGAARNVGATQLCVLATNEQAQPLDGTGNCLPLPRDVTA